ncbi:hypothetical protein [Rhizobium mesoamericanum]|uniref:Uncharacterized protein n=1 Tax=Rhizobium mesoamericanum STM3625 TaxID=1211777 RepID=K0PZV4_9HYPH|nr:hypothetical protein [Rhizobium mesoamericanum]CCM77087.1 hypothetical protein BN77_4133 [Rhizobium mesoamericanum STM3625]
MSDLNEKALDAAKRSYDAKYADMSSPCPTEEPEAGGGPLGYAIRAYLAALTNTSEAGILREALRRMEDCFEQLAATRTHEVYLAMIDDDYVIPDSQIIGELRTVEKTFRSKGELIAAAVCRDAASRLSALTNTSGDDEAPVACEVAQDLYEALKELLDMLRNEAPGTRLNNHRFDALGIKAHTALRKAERSARPQSAAVRDEAVPCPCTLIEQDEDCPVGYPSLLCGICEGKGHATQDQVTALACEMIKIASDMGEPEDPFAAWESISLVQSQNEQMRKALEKADQFITNGIDLGYIRMPDPNSGDTALLTPDIVRAALRETKEG